MQSLYIVDYQLKNPNNTTSGTSAANSASEVAQVQFKWRVLVKEVMVEAESNHPALR